MSQRDKHIDPYGVLWQGKPKSAETLGREIALDLAGIGVSRTLTNTLKAWRKAIKAEERKPQ